MADAAAVSVTDDAATRQALLVGAGMVVVYVLWGSVYVAVRVVVEHAPPLSSIGLRYVVAGGILGVVALIRHGPGAFRIDRTMLLGCTFLAIMLPVLTNGTVTVAVSLGVTAGPAALLSALVPISVVMLRLLAGDRPRRLTMVGVVVGFAGLAVLLLGGTSATGFPLGPSLVVVLSANCWALGSYLQPRLTLPRNTFVTAAFELVIGGLILTSAGVVSGEHMTWDYPTTTWLVLAYLTASSTVAFTTYVWLLDHAPISLVSTHAYVNPVVAVLLAWVLLAEPLTWPIIVGGGVVVTAVAIVISGERIQQFRSTPDAGADCRTET